MIMIFRKAKSTDRQRISEIRPTVYKYMQSIGYTQWNDAYPSEEILFEDIDKGHMYVALVDGLIAAYVTVDKVMPVDYENIPFTYDEPRACIHRLSIDPEYLRLGIATELMKYVHGECKKIGYNSIVLDTCEDNPGALGLFEKLGYTIRGNIKYEKRSKLCFPTMEKSLKK